MQFLFISREKNRELLENNELFYCIWEKEENLENLINVGEDCLLGIEEGKFRERHMSRRKASGAALSR